MSYSSPCEMKSDVNVCLHGLMNDYIFIQISLLVKREIILWNFVWFHLNLCFLRILSTRLGLVITGFISKSMGVLLNVNVPVCWCTVLWKARACGVWIGECVFQLSLRVVSFDANLEVVSLSLNLWKHRFSLIPS